MPIKPEITITLFPRKKKATTETAQEPTVDYVAASKEAAAELGQKFFLGAGAVAVATVVAATIGAIAVKAFEHALAK